MAKYTFFLSLLLTFVCSASLGAGKNSEKEVRFIIPIPVELFSKDATIVVRLWNREQIERMNNNSKCRRTHSLETHTTETNCPEGVEYLEITPEEFKFSIETILVDLEVLSKTIKVGDEYRLSVGGRSADDCNTTGASTRGTAKEETITLPTARTRAEEGLSWGTTLSYCN